MSALLRSGDIKNYTALGQDGQAVYTVATQLRDAIRFKRGRMFADYLAVPQRNDVGSTIDWYVPFESENPDGTYYIIPWTSATEEEKEKALSELDVFKANMLELGKDLARSDSLKGDQLLFSRLLYSQNAAESEQLKAIRFPNEEHIYLVNDRPVITFWGFVEKNQSPYADPFLCLREQEAKPTAPLMPLETQTPVEEKPSLCKRWWWLWLLLLLLLAGLLFYFLRPHFFPQEKAALPATTTELTDSNKKELKAAECKDPVTYYKVDGVLRDKEGKIKLLPRTCDIIAKDTEKFPYQFIDGKWVNKVDGKAVTDSTILRYLNEVPDAKALQEAQIEWEKLEKLQAAQSAVENSVDLNKDVTTLNSAAKTTDTLTQQGQTTDLANANQSTLSTDVTQANQQGIPPVDPNLNGNIVNNNPNQGIATDGQNQTTALDTAKNLNLDPQALAQGKTDFLNGNWSAGGGIQDKATGKPLKMRYSFENGQGKVTLERGDGVTCSGNVNAASSGSGLNINNSGIATCSDGSSYQLPNVVCKPTASGEADCSGSYGSGGSFPMSMKTTK